jgi:DUF4097 and DUF4098 domain-containing protein YvlB
MDLMEISMCSNAANFWGAGKLLTYISAAILFTMTAAAQTQAGVDRTTVSFTDPSRPGTVKAHLLNGSITVHAYNGKDVMVEARTRGEQDHERSGRNGAHRIVISATGLTVEEENNVMNISADSVSRTIDLTLQVPVRTSLVLKTVNDGNIEVTGVNGEIDVDDVNGKVTLSHISGAAVAHALNGEVLVTFDRIDPQKPMAFSSLNGNIDVTFPADLRANVSMRSDRGDVYSDFDIQMQTSRPRQVVEDNRAHGGPYRVKFDKGLYGTINGGGPEMQFKNFNGDIYIRKAGAPRG